MRDSCYALSKAFQKSRGLSENPEKLVVGYQVIIRFYGIDTNDIYFGLLVIGFLEISS